MELKKLLTYSFACNVGRADRVLRIVSGTGGAALAWYAGLPQIETAAGVILGLAWAVTGLISRCGLYYLFGFSTRTPDSSRLQSGRD